MLRIVVVIHAERFHRAEACDCRLADRSLRTAREHDVRAAVLDDTERVTDAVRARRARRHHAGGRAMQLVLD